MQSIKLIRSDIVSGNTLRIIKNIKGDILSKQLFSSDERILEEIKENMNKVIYKYDENGKLLYTITKVKEGIYNNQYFRYDPYGNTIYVTSKKEEFYEKLKRKIIDDNTIEYLIGKYKCRIKYDNKHRIIYFKNYKTNYEQHMIYGNNGLLQRFEDSNMLVETYLYDKDNNVLEFKRTLRNEQEYVEIYKYDTQNRAIYCRNSDDKEEYVEYEKRDKPHIEE